MSNPVHSYTNPESYSETRNIVNSWLKKHEIIRYTALNLEYWKIILTNIHHSIRNENGSVGEGNLASHVPMAFNGLLDGDWDLIGGSKWK